MKLQCRRCGNTRDLTIHKDGLEVVKYICIACKSTKLTLKQALLLKLKARVAER